MFYYTLLLLTFCPSEAWNIFSSESSQDSFKRAEYNAPERTDPPPKCLKYRDQIKENRFTCPQARELKKEGLRWGTMSGWRGYQDSFATDIKHFIGAQWKGVGVGRVICIYQSTDQNEFPIQLASDRLAHRPTYSRWENNTNKNLLNCISKKGDPCDCQFSYYIEEKEEDVDKIIESIPKK